MEEHMRLSLSLRQSPTSLLPESLRQLNVTATMWMSWLTSAFCSTNQMRYRHYRGSQLSENESVSLNKGFDLTLYQP